MTYKIPITWQSNNVFDVEATSLEEAVTKALRKFLSELDENYIEDSFEIDRIIEEDYPNETYNINKVIESL
jgi:hypothetical protein